jgi:hypothetical protein
MPAPTRPTEGQRLREAGERLIEAGYRWDDPSASLLARQQLHDEVEAALDDGRTVVRGRGFR